MGDRYLEVPESWEDRHMEAPSDDTVSTSVSTQAGEETLELSVVADFHHLYFPELTTNGSPPTKSTQPSDGTPHQAILNRFLVTRLSPGPPKKVPPSSRHFPTTVTLKKNNVEYLSPPSKVPSKLSSPLPHIPSAGKLVISPPRLLPLYLMTLLLSQKSILQPPPP